MDTKFELYVVDPFDTIVPPIVILSVYERDGHPKAAWFLAIPSKKNEVFGQVSNFDARSFKGSSIDIDESFMLQEVREQAQLKLRNIIYKKHRGRGSIELYETPRLVDTESTTLIHYWLRGDCQEQIIYILKNTECVSLRSFLEEITSLPTIERHDL